MTEDIERLLLRWRYDDLQNLKAAEIASKIISLTNSAQLKINND